MSPCIEHPTWRNGIPHPFEHCCTDGWNGRRICQCGFSEGNKAVHPQRESDGPE